MLLLFLLVLPHSYLLITDNTSNDSCEWAQGNVFVRIKNLTITNNANRNRDYL